MKSILITGIGGFVGRHLCRHLQRSGNAILGVDRPGHNRDELLQSLLDSDISTDVKLLNSNLSQLGECQAIFNENRLDAIIHLAGVSFVPESWENPSLTVDSNILTTVNLLQAAKASEWRGRFLLISSGDIYGAHPNEAMPLTEKHQIFPGNPYAVSKRAAEEFSLLLNNDTAEVIIARPFNHIGPGQNRRFVLPAFIERVVEASRKNEDEIVVGDLDATRDFTDVRDVIRAYEILLERGVPGETYNVCSGRQVKIREMLDLVIKVTGKKVGYRIDPKLVRNEVSSIRYGSAEKLNELGWQPEHSLEDTIRDVYSEIRESITS